LARKILLADDSVTAQNMGRKILADAGYDVVTVNNGSAALKRIAEIKPDLIVLDVYMPGYSGLEVCQRLKDSDETAHIPVLLTVGKLEPFKPEEARRVKAEGHIVKPFEASELLTAITRLEDRVVPQQPEGGRFGADGNGRKSDSGGGADTGWKSRLGFSAKKKKEEKDDSTAGSFRDFRKVKTKAVAAETSAETVTAKKAEPVADIPRDITPEELDVLSALAAKLGGQVPKPEQTAPASDAVKVAETSQEVPIEVSSDLTAAAKVAAANSAVEAEKLTSPEVETSAPTEQPLVAAETPAFAAEGKSEIEIPVEHIDAIAEVATVADPVASEALPTAKVEDAVAKSADEQSVDNQSSDNQFVDTQTSEPIAVISTVDIASLAQEAAPVDRSDEPMFATSVNVSEQTAAEATESQTQPEAVGAGAPVANFAVNSEITEVAAVAPVHETGAVEDPAPSDEELAQALRLLTPAEGSIASASSAFGTDSRPRWIAEAVALTSDETTISLEAEMFRAFTVGTMTMSGGEITPPRFTGVSALVDAVENRLVAAQSEAAAKSGTPGAAPAVADHFAPNDSVDAAPQTVQEDPTSASAATASETTANVADTVAVESAPDNSAVATPPAEMESQDSTSQMGGDDSMGKNAKSNSASSNASEMAEKSEPAKAMAAAAASERGSTSSSSSTPDASTIASIVESVMADLRPRIVEEIVKKLTGK
jgi:CheY-like chemotaxis protein